MKKALLLLTFAAASLTAVAEEVMPQWYIATDTGEKALVSEVQYLMAADDETTFSVILSDGSYYSGITRATFEHSLPSGIDSVRDNSGTVVKYAAQSLTIMGAKDRSATIYDLSGNAVKTAAISDTTTIDISSLPAAAYLLKIGDTTVKFIKK